MMIFQKRIIFSYDIRRRPQPALKEIIESNQMRNMPDTPAMIPMLIPDPAFVKRKVFLA
jgi:hypothetical protein